MPDLHPGDASKLVDIGGSRRKSDRTAGSAALEKADRSRLTALRAAQLPGCTFRRLHPFFTTPGWLHSRLNAPPCWRQAAPVEKSSTGTTGRRTKPFREVPRGKASGGYRSSTGWTTCCAQRSHCRSPSRPNQPGPDQTCCKTTEKPGSTQRAAQPAADLAA